MKQIIFFDLETTGTDTATDRIVQLSALKVSALFDPIEGEEIKDILINPGHGILIPEEASKVHGITNEMVKNKPVFANYAKALFEYLDGCDVAGFNIKRFDVPLLSEEFARVGLTWPAPGMQCLDGYQIFANKEPRDLTGALKFYCNKEHEGAHDAKADILATIDVVRAQTALYSDIKGKSIDEINKALEGDEPWLDLAGKIVLKDGVPVYGFGKDKGKSIKENPGFGTWMLKNAFTTDTKNHIKRILYGEK